MAKGRGLHEGERGVASRGLVRARIVGGVLLAACVVLYAAAGALLFSSLSVGWKAGAVSVLVVIGEGCFWLAAVVIGREVVRRYRRFFNPLNWFGGGGARGSGTADPRNRAARKDAETGGEER